MDVWSTGYVVFLSKNEEASDSILQIVEFLKCVFFS